MLQRRATHVIIEKVVHAHLRQMKGLCKLVLRQFDFIVCKGRTCWKGGHDPRKISIIATLTPFSKRPLTYCITIISTLSCITKMTNFRMHTMIGEAGFFILFKNNAMQQTYFNCENNLVGVCVCVGGGRRHL